MCNSHAYGPTNFNRPLENSHSFISNSSGNSGNQMKEAYLRGTSTTPSTIYAYGNNFPRIPAWKIGDVSYCPKFSSIGQIPNLNFISGSLTSNRHESFQLNSFIPQVQQRYNGNGIRLEDSRYRKKTLPKIIPCNQLDMSPPKTQFIPQLNHTNFNSVKVFPKCHNPMRRRVRSDNSTASSNSHSSKYIKTSEGYSGSHRAKGSYSESRSRTNHGQKSSSPKNSNKRESYNMKRLDLGHHIDSVRHQQELMSRLETMAFNNKVLKEDHAIVVPSLPAIFSTSKP